MRHLLLLLVASLALPAADLTLSPSSGSVVSGQTLTVQVLLAGGPATTRGAQVRLDFDKTRLAYVSALKDAAASDVTINDSVATVNTNGTLKALLDYPAATASSGTLLTVTFTAIASGTATISAVPSSLPYGCRVFDGAYNPVTLNLPAGATAITISAPVAGTLAFSAATYTRTEGNSGSGTATITVTRSGGSAGAVGVNYTSANGTATAGSDYSVANGTLSWANGDAAAKTFTVTVTGDTAVEPDETVLLTLSAPTGGAVLGSSTATLGIVNDDVASQGGGDVAGGGGGGGGGCGMGSGLGLLMLGLMACFARVRSFRRPDGLR
jgi:hypothetical protein